MTLKRAGKTAQASATNFKTIAFAWLEKKEGAELSPLFLAIILVPKFSTGIDAEV